MADLIARRSVPFLSRRELFVGSGALFAWTMLPKFARAEGRDPRMLTIVLRGALDGLAAVAPVGDPDWAALRGDNALTLDSKTAALKLDDFFALHPSMPNLQRLFQSGQAIIVHAVASPYRERSHFDGQDVLESGQQKPGITDSGWLNRALATLASEGRAQAPAGQGLAVGPVTPLIVRGPAPVLVWAPQKVPPASDDTLMRLLDLYHHTDTQLAHELEDRVNLKELLRSGGAPASQMAPATQAAQARATQARAYFAEAAAGAAQVLAHADGPRIGALALDGWDTHANEGVAGGQLAQLLAALDAAIAAVERGMGPAWQDTVVAIVTEFGRTAHINGTDGTDHGTATVALLVGGALKGGRVIADWPGLKTPALFEGRDLAPTTNLYAVLKGLLRDHLRVDERALASTVFPGSDAVKPMPGLIAAA